MNSRQLLSICAAVLIVFVLVWIAVRAIRWAKKGTKAGAMLAAAAFPFPEQPSPHEQVANANRLKKGAQSGDPE